MFLNFEKAKTNRIFQGIVEQIQEAIINGSLKPGDVLPSEIKLKDVFETSRGTIREAYRVLEQKGLVDIKTGVSGGAIVKAVDTKNIVESLDLLIQLQKVSLDHLTEFREWAEGIVAFLAAEKATKKDIQILKQLQSEAYAVFKRKNAKYEDFIPIDIKTHITIAKIAGNPLFEANLRMIHENISVFFETNPRSNNELIKKNYKALCELIRIIENRKAKEAQLVAQKHVQEFKRYLKKRNKY